MQSITNSINTFPVRIISSFSGQNSYDQDLYDELSENAAKPIVNYASSVKFIDLETCLQLDVRNHPIGY
ncbi:MAG: hypothetical protein EZS28_016501 [Streblomastix strix]|uniref:Uncharacterized protein n=1 Tax=Streblomastix strix TaxID=222440 RepID=A0A5J4VZG8_9EUKA|nr:MAG: hypothetical protein EZS28_016501 [Streblomastix strix]